ANWYLLGCAHLQACEVAAAAACFGKAYHAEWRLESAALLTFACLKASAADGGLARLHDIMLTTWSEVGRPPLGRRAVERQLIAAAFADRDRKALTFPMDAAEFSTRLVACGAAT